MSNLFTAVSVEQQAIVAGGLSYGSFFSQKNLFVLDAQTPNTRTRTLRDLGRIEVTGITDDETALAGLFALLV
jgi:hypothetical protein